MSDRQEILGRATKKKMPLMQYMRHNASLYLMSLPGLAILILFSYVPMYGVVLAFKQYSPKLGIWGSKWVWFKYFEVFFRDPFALRVIKNSFVLGLLSLTLSFPSSIIMALMLNEVRLNKTKRIMQTISYMPHFISTVIVVSILNDIFASPNGPVNTVLMSLGLIKQPITFIATTRWFRTLYIGSGIWSSVGFGSIIYMAAMTNINSELYESAILDGANRMQRIWHITLPGIRPTIIILFIMAMGGIMNSDMEKVLLMYSARNYAVADTLATYAYRMGLEGMNFSLGSAVGLFNNLVGLFFLLITNFICAKVGETSLI